MYVGHGHLCMSVCLLSLTAFPHYCTDPYVTWSNGRGCPLVAHCCADLQSVHGFRCYDNIAPNVKCQQVLVLALCLVLVLLADDTSHICTTVCLYMMLVHRPVGAYGVPVQYERSFRWKLGQFRYLCSVSHTDRFPLQVTDRQTDRHPFNGLCSWTTWVSRHQKG